MITGNKGEWSEAYVLLKLLGDKKIHIGDENLNRIEKAFYPIIKVLREEANGKTDFIVDGDIILIVDSNDELRIPILEFKKQASYLFKKIKSSTGRSFSITETEKFLNSIKCTSLKSKPSEKTDIRIVIHDPKTNLSPELGFSIKSKLGSPATLLNASKATNFIFSVQDIEMANISEFNNIKNFNQKFDLLDEIGAKVEFIDVSNSTFGNNLMLIDTSLPKILANIIYKYYSTTDKEIRVLTQKVTLENPLKFDQSQKHNFYEHKIKRFLTDVALGMMPSKVWNGEYETKGGYLIVKENGDVLCYHIYEKNQFEDYLFANTKLETGSTSRHGFGKIYQINNKSHINLNLQIRFY